jgi:FMN phosphatase YigB (HAD superfamily)
MKTILVDAINGLILEDGTIFKEMQELFDSYPNRKIVLTGANDEQFKQFNLDKSPYEVFTLKHDPEKTDVRYWHILLEKYDLKSEDTVYFEHNKHAAETAQSVGIPTYYYDHTKADLAALKAFIDEQLK